MKVSEVKTCLGCPMRTLFPENSYVPPQMGTSNRLALGEAPGLNESVELKPFCGGAGRVAQSLYSKAGVQWDSLTVLNTLQCRPLDNKYPTSSEARSYISKEDAEKAVEHCYENHVKPVLMRKKWTRIDALGDHALQALTDEKGITRWRGSILKEKLTGEQVVVPTYHPSYILRDWNQGPTFISDIKKSLVIPPQNYNCYPSLQDAQNYNHKRIVVDLETNRFTGEILLVGFSDRAYNATVFPFRGPYIPEIKRIIQEADEIITQNGLQFDIPTLKKNGIFPKASCEIQDTILAHALVSPDQEHNLGYMGSIYTNVQAWKHTAEDNKEHYCATDCDVTMQIWLQLKALLKQLELWDIYSLVSIPAAMICAEMKRLGVKLDHSKVRDVRERIIKEQQSLETNLPEKLKTHQVPVSRRMPAAPGTLGKSGKPVRFVMVPSSETVVPWRSPKLVGDYLYTELGLPTQKQVKTGKRTVDKVALSRLVKIAGGNTEAVKALAKLNSLDEILSTFSTEAMKYTSDIHSNFNVQGTNSGRLSSSEPNLQNIPGSVRRIYVPHYQDYVIVQADFASIENRLTALLANDAERLARFSQEGWSEHKWAVEKFFGIPMDEVEKSSDPDSDYSKAKHIVHGSNYGLGARKMSLMYGIPEKEVKSLREKWRAAIPKTVAWQEATAAEASKEGYLTNPFGRKRWFGTPNTYTESLSFLPQSAAADVILRCMIGLTYDRINWPAEKAIQVCPVLGPLPKRTNLILQVHDALVVETPVGLLDETVAVIKKVMCQPWKQLSNWSCPIAVEWGHSWGELEEYEIK